MQSKLALLTQQHEMVMPMSGLLTLSLSHRVAPGQGQARRSQRSRSGITNPRSFYGGQNRQVSTAQLVLPGAHLCSV